jgi:hypothetical protein
MYCRPSSGGDDRYLLFEWLEDYCVMGDASLALHVRGLGRMCATVNQHGAVPGRRNPVIRKLQSFRTARKSHRELNLLRRLE